MSGARIICHNIGGGFALRIAGEVPANIPVGDDAFQQAVFIGNACAAEAASGDDLDQFGHWRRRRRQRQRISAMHQIARLAQRSAEFAAGMKALKIAGRKSARPQQGDSKRIAERHHHSCRGGGRERLAASFFCFGQGERDPRGLGER